MCAAFLPDGRRTVSSGYDRTIRLWDVGTGQEIHCFRGHTNEVTWVAVSPDGRRLLSSDYGGHELRLWDVETRKQVDRIKWGTVSPTRGSFTPDGRHAVWGGSDGVIRMYRLSAPDKDKTDHSAAPTLPGPSQPPAVTHEGPRPADAISPQTKAILAALDESIPMDFANETPLNDVLTYIKQAKWKGRKPTDADIPIYVDPLGLKETGKTLASTVRMNVTGVPLNVALPQLLGQLGLAYNVKDEVLMISSFKDIERERNEAATLAVDASPKTKLVEAMLDQLIPMSFAIAPSLDDVLSYIKQATTTPSSDGIPIFVDQTGLQEAKRSLASTVSMDLYGVPLKTTLKLMLKQFGLAYTVKDGRLIISSAEGIGKLKVAG